MSYSQETLKLTDALTQLEIEIKTLTADLERYKKTKNFSERLVFYKDQQIKVLLNVLESIRDFKELSDDIFFKEQKQIAKKEELIFKFEGICLLHGISDFTNYLDMSVTKLTNLVKEAYTEKWRQTPLQLMPGYQLIEQIKTAKAPTIDFKQLLNAAINNRNTN